MYPDLPIEFNVIGTPVSFQSTNGHAKREWKDTVLNAAKCAIGGTHWAFDRTRLAVTLLYFPDVEMDGDVDNIVKLTLDALEPHIYVNDALVDRLVVQRFEPNQPVVFVRPSATLLDAMAANGPALFIKLQEVDLTGVAI